LATMRLGRYPEAEAASRERLELPPDRFSDDDPEDERSAAHTLLAHALAGQGKLDEARQALQPALEYYRTERERGAAGVTFSRDFAYALYVSALVEPGDAAGRARGKTALSEAAALVDGLPDEARRLADLRTVSGWIDSQRKRAM
ncbi:MAG: hypothetical protein KBE42_12855, partial [Steroidobacteraceae bacterium]|nr:hypothetical protein [Steroidobacteraceae bacterium]